MVLQAAVAGGRGDAGPGRDGGPGRPLAAAARHPDRGGLAAGGGRRVGPEQRRLPGAAPRGEEEPRPGRGGASGLVAADRRRPGGAHRSGPFPGQRRDRRAADVSLPRRPGLHLLPRGGEPRRDGDRPGDVRGLRRPGNVRRGSAASGVGRVAAGAERAGRGAGGPRGLGRLHPADDLVPRLAVGGGPAAARGGTGGRQPATAGGHRRTGQAHAANHAPAQGPLRRHPGQYATAVGRVLRQVARRGPAGGRSDRRAVRHALAADQGHAPTGEPPLRGPGAAAAGGARPGRGPPRVHRGA